MNFVFDLDSTLCNTTGNDYKSCTPKEDRIAYVNELYNKGHIITIYTARGMGTFKGDVNRVYFEYFELTKQQLEKWELKYHNLILGKPSYDVFICDKAVTADTWFESNNKQYISGVIAGAFDAMHPGYVKMFKQCKKYCNKLIVALHEDPSLENNKLKPVLSVDEKKEMLLALEDVDSVLVYRTENDLVDLLKTYANVRFLGDDYKDKQYTGSDLNLPVIYIDRSHNWSTTKYKRLIYEQFKN